ncbi:MAG: flagellar hook-basal body complex protein FliE [Elusimicrobiota bacterium]
MEPIHISPKVTEAGVPNLKPVDNSSSNQISFNHLFSEIIDQTNNNITDADKTVKDFVQGKIDNPHEVMIRLEEAHLALQFTVQMRNKVVEAYQELMRMQL